MTAKRMNWDITNPFKWYDDRGKVLELLQTSPKMLKQKIKEAYERGLPTKMAKRCAGALGDK